MFRRISQTIFLMTAAMLAIAAGSGPVRADFVLGFGEATYAAVPGQGVDVPVYLIERGTTILATDGLNGAGLVVSFNLAAMVPVPAQVTLIIPNSGVNDIDDFLSTTINSATNSSAGTAELMFSIVLSDVLRPPAGSSSVLLGTFHFLAESVPGEVTNLSTGILAGGPQFLSGTGQELDSLITTATASITVNAEAIPEPTGVLLLSSGILGLVVFAHRSRRPCTA